jgi:hypothetical protein
MSDIFGQYGKHLRRNEVKLPLLLDFQDRTGEPKFRVRTDAEVLLLGRLAHRDANQELLRPYCINVAGDPEAVRVEGIRSRLAIERDAFGIAFC